MYTSHVTMEQHQCPICLAIFETGNILLDQRLRKKFEMKTLTGHSPCTSCKEKLSQGFVALIETTDTRQGSKATLDVPRSGNLVFMKREAFSQIFNVPPPANWPPMVFIEPGVIQQLQALLENSDQTHH